MGNEPRNQAADQIRLRYPELSRVAQMTAADITSLRQRYTDDFVREDRRKVVTIPAATFDEFIDSLKSYWELGSGPPSFTVAEVVETRGERVVLFRSRVEFGDGTSTESLAIVEFDEQMRARHGTMFDPDDLETALGELEQRHPSAD